MREEDVRQLIKDVLMDKLGIEVERDGSRLYVRLLYNTITIDYDSIHLPDLEYNSDDD